MAPTTTVTITSIMTTCSACPVQLEGTLSNGWSFYARSRFNWWSVSLHPRSVDAAAEGSDEEVISDGGSLDSDSLDTGSVDDLEARLRRFVDQTFNRPAALPAAARVRAFVENRMLQQGPVDREVVMDIWVKDEQHVLTYADLMALVTAVEAQ